MKISIIIVTYNSIGLIKDCLESIFKYNDIGDELEVIIVDNHSSDQAQMFDLVRSSFPNNPIHLYDTGSNGGYGKGNNFGIARSKSDIIVIMNPDVRLIYPIFRTILKEFEDTSLGVIGVEFIDGSSPYYFKPENYSLWHLIFEKVYNKRRIYNEKMMYMSGSLMAFNKQAFVEAGSYDENIFMYYEEPDITNRIQKTGKKAKWLKGVHVLHLAHGRKFNKNLTDFRNSSLEYYCNKYGVNVVKLYRKSNIVLRMKILLSKCLRDSHRMELFSRTLSSQKERLESLKR